MANRLKIIMFLAALCIVISYRAAAAPAPGTAVKILSPSMFPTWQGWHVCYPFVIADSSAGGYRMYYSGAGSCQNNDSLSDQWMTGSVTSPDTTTWTRPDNYEPILLPRKLYEGDLIDPDDMSAQFDSMFAIGACVIRESSSSYKMWYTGWNGDTEGAGVVSRINFRIGYATSSNGTSWQKQPGSAGGGAILGLGAAGQSDAKGVGQPHVIKEGSNYRMWYEGFDGTYWRVFYATSSNGTTWTKQGVALNRGSAGTLDELGLRNPVVDSRNGQYEMWYQGQSAAAHNYHVLRATSSNGLTWTKVPTEVTLHPGDAVDGSEMIHVDSVIVNPDNSAQVFFAKHNTTAEPHTYDATIQKQYYNIYTEVIP